MKIRDDSRFFSPVSLFFSIARIIHLDNSLSRFSIALLVAIKRIIDASDSSVDCSFTNGSNLSLICRVEFHRKPKMKTKITRQYEHNFDKLRYKIFAECVKSTNSGDSRCTFNFIPARCPIFRILLLQVCA